jgi:hypothetical protein
MTEDGRQPKEDSRSPAKKDIDKVSFAGIFDKLLNSISPLETLVGLVSAEMPFGNGREKGVIPITEALDTHNPTVKRIGFIDSCYRGPDASAPPYLLCEQAGD